MDQSPAVRKEAGRMEKAKATGRYADYVFKVACITSGINPEVAIAAPLNFLALSMTRGPKQ